MKMLDNMVVMNVAIYDKASDKKVNEFNFDITLDDTMINALSEGCKEAERVISEYFKTGEFFKEYGNLNKFEYDILTQTIR